MSQNQFYKSGVYKSIYYGKKSMKELLDERSKILQRLHLKLQKEPDQQSIIETVLLLFKENPLTLADHQILVLKEHGAHYVFFSCDDSFVPVCKRCLSSTYLTLKGTEGRITCCNTTCKHSLLEEFEINVSQSGTKQPLNFQIYQSHQADTKRSQSRQTLSELDMEKIRKAAKKMIAND